jgi:acyl-[acyl-carrier-protein]-phospholipid O-acyltransferase/long-chain-fatty-acid--[acyl-carrier-protein] ligase
VPATACRLTGVLTAQVGLGAAVLAGVLLPIAALLALVLVYLSLHRPEVVVRLLLWLPAHLLYRIRVFGRENIPRTGPALFVCNHVSFIDAFLVFLAQRRVVRFVVWAPYTRLPGLGFLLRLARVIPIDGSAGPRAILQALRVAGDALRRGEVVCIFAEGAISRTGFLLPFNRGFEQILKRSPAPVIPVCLDHVWGSIFSYQGGKFFWKWPQTLPYPVTIAFGKPLPPAVRAVEVRQAIQKLSADCAVARTSERRPVHRQFVRMACRHPLRSCLVDPEGKGRNFRYGMFLAGGWLLRDLLRPLVGDDPMVGVWLPPSPGGAFVNLALSLMGKTSVNLNYTASTEVVQSAIRQCGIRHVLTVRRFTKEKPLDPGAGVELVNLEDYRKRVSTWQRVRRFLAVVLLPGYALEHWVLGLGRHKPDDLATVIFSSGSTGDPKGVMLTHANLAANAESMIQAIDPRPSDRLLGILPFFHSFGYTVTLWVPLQVGTSMVFHPDPRQAKEIGELCKKYRCTIFVTTPTLLRFCLRRCEPDDFRSLRLLMVGAEKLPPGLAQEFKEKFGVLPMEGYGCTELSPAAVVNVPDREEGGVRQIGNRPGTIGQPIPGVATRIVDPDTLQPLPADKDGMLLVYGGNVMKGYLGRPEATRDAIRDGWYITGDIARTDEDGFITITDRLARFSKIGGEMVPHQKIEDELHTILGTSERVCAVTSVADERRGERLVVLHTPLNGTSVQELHQRLSNLNLPNLWIPDRRDFVQIPEMPLLGTGKVDLKRIREMAKEQAGGDKAEGKGQRSEGRGQRADVREQTNAAGPVADS